MTTAGGSGGKADYAPEIDPARFTTTIDNPYAPFVPGTRWVYEGVGDEGETERDVVEVTSETKVVMGVTTVVVHDTVSVNGQVKEDTDDWYAQDDAGNVWYFGEDTTELDEDGTSDTSGSWEAGVDGAQPGIIMEADPEVGDKYRQEFYEGEAEDRGEVLALDERVTVRLGAFDHVLVTKDTTPLEPELVEHKYYARGVGVVKEETVEGGSDRAELVEMTTA